MLGVVVVVANAAWRYYNSINYSRTVKEAFSEALRRFNVFEEISWRFKIILYTNNHVRFKVTVICESNQAACTEKLHHFVRGLIFTLFRKYVGIF